ncbi:hypothetical protein Trydic_g575 [Trypoxylus dichotomus]
MLYVFHVDTGTMMTCDMNLALESVHHLKQYIQRTCNIPCDKQVLLVSGGESLDPDSRVCSYSAGTDTNPIFLFSKSVIESTTPPSGNVELVSDAERAFLEKVKEATADLPHDYATVVHRTQLAQQFYEMAKEQAKICKQLVHDQHLQQQGWAAVVANLEDITTEFKKRADLCEKQFSDYMNEHDSYMKFLQSFHEDLQILSRIPLLPVLLESEKLVDETLNAESSATTTNETSENSESTKKDTTLLGWISASDSKNSIDQLYEMCSRGLQQFDQNVYTAIKADIKTALEDANQPTMKEVRGIGDRLFGLEQLMNGAKKYVQEQSDLAQSFLQNQNRAGNLRDISVLPDLCASHRKQLLVMFNNHQQLGDIRRRCTKAKEELIVNLYYRLKWVMYVENTILEISHRLFIYHENLKRLRKHLEVLQQIHLAPAIYLTAITEVVRRKIFSQAFLVWASELACHLLTIHNNEVARRKEFQSQFEGHFLNPLFPGMDDLPPTFATQAPSVFDSSLPNISTEDLETLKTALPEMTEKLDVPDLSAILTFFDSKQESKFEKEETIGVVEELVQEVQDLRLSANAEQSMTKENESCLIAPSLPYLKDLDRGCESETDTEEFEKVCQSPLDLHFDKEIPSPRTKTQDVATITEDNLQTSRTEYDKLKSVLHKLAELMQQALPNLRAELSTLKDISVKERDEIVKHYESLTESLEKMNLDLYLREQTEVETYRKDLECKNEELKCLHNTNISLENQFKTCMQENVDLKNEIDKLKAIRETESAELKDNLEKFEEEKERLIKDREALVREHRTEVDNLRSRFKLMMDQSPPDVGQDRFDHFREDFENQKAEAVENALSLERNRWEHVMKDTIAKITKEKDEQLQLLVRENEEKERLLNELKLECGAAKGCQTENDSLSESKKVDEMAASVGLFEGRVDAATSPVRHQEKLTKSQVSLLKSGKFSRSSCVTGDIVLVVWEPAHENYKILQESSTLYFLHSDCLEGLGLKKVENEEQRPYCLGQVTNKEYCHARKAQNRYRVPIGTKFYRVSVKPVNLESLWGVDPTSCSRHPSQQMSESQPAALPSTEHQSQQSGAPTTSQSTLARSKSTMESSIVTGCTVESSSSQNESLSSNRNTFSYFLNDTWIVGSQWIVENS